MYKKVLNKDIKTVLDGVVKKYEDDYSMYFEDKFFNSILDYIENNKREHHIIKRVIEYVEESYEEPEDINKVIKFLSSLY